MVTREIALEKLHRWVQDPGLRGHCLALEQVMSGLAKRAGLGEDDQRQWALSGLLHDADWQAFPARHPQVIVDWLRQHGESTVADAVAAHGAFWGVPHATLMSRALVASDELTGFIEAYRRVRPAGLVGLTGAQVVKKLRNRAFAEGVDRREVAEGARIWATSVEEHAQDIIDILHAVASD